MDIPIRDLPFILITIRKHEKLFLWKKRHAITGQCFIFFFRISFMRYLLSRKAGKISWLISFEFSQSFSGSWELGRGIKYTWESSRWIKPDTSVERKHINSNGYKHIRIIFCILEWEHFKADSCTWECYYSINKCDTFRLRTLTCIPSSSTSHVTVCVEFSIMSLISLPFFGFLGVFRNFWIIVGKDNFHIFWNSIFWKPEQIYFH